jgi:hypothetical protein
VPNSEKGPERKIPNNQSLTPLLSARSDEATYLVDGIPAARGIAEKAIGIISGRFEKTADVCRGEPTRWILEAMRSDKPYGATDLATYYRLMTLGQYYNGVKDFAAAENRYREALTFHRTIVGEGDPEYGSANAYRPGAQQPRALRRSEFLV